MANEELVDLYRKALEAKQGSVDQYAILTQLTEGRALGVEDPELVEALSKAVSQYLDNDSNSRQG